MSNFTVTASGTSAIEAAAATEQLAEINEQRVAAGLPPFANALRYAESVLADIERSWVEERVRRKLAEFIRRARIATNAQLQAALAALPPDPGE